MKYESIITHNLFKFSTVSKKVHESVLAVCKDLAITPTDAAITTFALRFLTAYRRCKGSRSIILRNSTLNGYIFPLVSEQQLTDADSSSSDSGEQSGDSGVQSGESEEESEAQSFKSFPLWKKYRLTKDLRKLDFDLLQFAYQHHPKNSAKKKKVKRMPSLYCLKLKKRLNITTRQYVTLQKAFRECGGSRLATIKSLRDTKKSFLPDGIQVDKYGASVPLQNLMDKTSLQVVKAKNIDTNENDNLLLIGKCGGDGQGMQSDYNQKRDDRGSNFYTQAYVPLELKRGTEVIWKNDNPNSRDWCRPILQKWTKESEEFIQESSTQLLKEIEELQPTIIGGMTIHHEVHPSMWDGKSLIAISKKMYRDSNLAKTVSTQQCHLCLKKMSSFGDFFDCPILNPNILKFGAAPLHILIRTFEDLFKAAVKKKAAEENVDKDEIKKSFQKQFWEELGLRVFYPKNGGSSNSGNTSRGFYDQVEKSARILGISEDLIRNTKALIGMLSNQKEIPNPDSFHEAAEEVWRMYYDELGTYKDLCPTYHRLLQHGAEFLRYAEKFQLPPGSLSESSIEHCNSLNRNVRLNFTRKFSPAIQNFDTFSYMLSNSDPLINI